MRFDEGHESPDLQDRRGQAGPGGGGGGIGGFIFLLPMLLRHPLLLLVVVVVGGGYYLIRGFGSSDAPAPRGNPDQPAQQQPAGPAGAAKTPDELGHHVAFVLDDVQATWDRELPAQANKPYRHAKLVLFTHSVATGCGNGQAASGPFYCPQDEHAYIDLSFYRELATRFGAKGDFAQAYVIAHEIGHHVQKIVGTSDRVHNASRGQLEGASGLSVRLELQADCYAGVWAHSTEQRHLLDVGDIDQALTAASAIGDDRLQKQATGTVSPETWTHGSSAERVKWFKAGYADGKMSACDTFGSTSL